MRVVDCLNPSCWLRGLVMIGMGLVVPACAPESPTVVDLGGNRDDDDDEDDDGPATSGPVDPSGTNTTAPDTMPPGDGSLPGDNGVSTDVPNPEDGGIPREAPVVLHGQLRVEGTRLLDASGTAVQLKGPSSMWLNWEETGFASNRGGMEFLRDDWNATIVRAAMGIEPDGAYLTNTDEAKNDARNVIDTAIDLGMYVIIDWHDHEAEAHQDEAIAFFTEMAQQYGQLPNVIYEVYNEPLDIGWNEVLKPYHEAVVAAIRAVDPDNVIILGTPNWSQDVDIAAENPVVGTNLMYTLHFYACSHDSYLRDKATSALDRGLPLFVTEWGATNSDGGTPENPGVCEGEANVWHDWMNERQVSWTAWKLDDCEDETCYFRPNVGPGGNWNDGELNGHATFVRDRMRE